ncbi:alpha-amylase family glycosyl hydrolase [Croceicoccus bisphenolivorans]|uniref:alpha-amylase family glycosyl hydrolase n=1 Tax=Croceicoccus bisphenolivorans TaxID=1783232 RepID=UPI0009ED217D|nr:alpha-amylase family glycosyl hydrolase [Croceicoccus bisphenolivorans]
MRPGREALIAEAMLHDPRSSHADAEWWRGAMFYEIYLRSFKDSDGDGIGDLKGVLDKLDYVESLGVDGLWLSPFYPSPQKDFGYDITDFCNVDPMFGSMGDFLDLIGAVHDRNLKLLIDLVPCHTSEEHPWFLESRSGQDNAKADWYIWADSAPDGGPPNNWLSSFGGSAWEWDPRRSQYYYHPFLTCQPALNLRNPEVLRAIIGVFEYWMDRGVDGFRLDAIQCLCCDPWLRPNPSAPGGEANIMVGGGPNNPFRKQLHLFDRDVPEAIPILEAMRDAVRKYEPERVLIGELADVDSSRMAVKYTLRGERLHAVYDFDLINGAKSLDDWRELLSIRARFMASGWMMNVFTNHDSVRSVSNLTLFAEEEGDRAAAAKLLLFMQSTLLGGGIIFQGEELGLPQPELEYEDLQDPWGKNLWPDFAGRDGVRTPIPWTRSKTKAGFTTAKKAWLPVPPEHSCLSVSAQNSDENSVLNFFRSLMAWRRNEPLIRRGDELVYDVDVAPVIAYDRFDDARCLTFVVNVSLDQRWFPTDDSDELIDLDGCVAKKSKHGIELPPLGFAIIQRGERAGTIERSVFN